MATAKPILFVDDDANALAGFQRVLRDKFPIEVAQGAQRALQAINTQGPFAVIVSDMRMPVMNGVQFLQRAHEIAPDTVRIMLTGNADLQTAIDAVNDGAIFQFLCKPCSTPQLAKSLSAAVTHHELICSERELLEKTLRGSVKVLTDVLSLVNPSAFGRAMRIADIVRQLAAGIAPRDAWQFELAALLSQLGCVTLSPALLDAINTGAAISEEDRQRYDAHPAVAQALIAHIPRLGDVAEMIARQRESASASAAATADPATTDLATLGARMLRVALDLDAMVSAGVPQDEAVVHLRSNATDYDPRLLQILTSRAEVRPTPTRRPARVPLESLQLGMEVQEDVRTAGGLLLIASGQTITPALLGRLGNFLRLNAIFGSVRVLR